MVRRNIAKRAVGGSGNLHIPMAGNQTGTTANSRNNGNPIGMRIGQADSGGNVQDSVLCYKADGFTDKRMVGSMTG